jgi:NitT/TauT family transport system substrate-binding protein
VCGRAAAGDHHCAVGKAPFITIRFYALRLYERGFIKSTPPKIIAGATDWRFFNELKRELKA